MLSPLTLRDITFNSGVIQGPLAGYSCAPFRRLIWQHSQPAFCYTEMLPARQICIENGNINRYTFKHPDEGPLCYQLSGCSPEYLAQATQIVDALGADCIDLNAGCPKPKMRKKGHGSALLAHPDQLYQCLIAMRRATEKPLLLKIRVDGNSTERNNSKVAQAALKAGIDGLVIHGRHWLEDDSTPCSYHQAQFFHEALPNIPIIWNGDISTPQSIKHITEATGCKHVMVARGSMGRPDWIHSLMHPSVDPASSSLARSAQWLKQHLDDLSTLEPAGRVYYQSRSIVHYYAKHLPLSEGIYLKQLINQADTLIKIINNLNNLIQDLDKQQL